MFTIFIFFILANMFIAILVWSISVYKRVNLSAEQFFRSGVRERNDLEAYRYHRTGTRKSEVLARILNIIRKSRAQLKRLQAYFRLLPTKGKSLPKRDLSWFYLMNWRIQKFWKPQTLPEKMLQGKLGIEKASI